MFRKIERSLALQFTTFVFVLLMVNGVIFLAADVGNEKRQMRQRMENRMSDIQHAFPSIAAGDIADLYLSHVERIRVTDPAGETVFSGELFEDVPFTPDFGTAPVSIGREEFMVLTEPIMQDGEVKGYVQVAEPERAAIRQLIRRSGLYVLVSLLISLLTYLAGRQFAKRSLRPAEAMLVRLEQFTQDASHELRTPLAVLGSSLDLALKTKEYKEGIESAKDDLKQISDLVERLLDIARLNSMTIEKRPTNLSVLVTDAVEKFAPLAKESGLTVTLSSRENVRTDADATLVHQMLWNLLSNAVKFSSRGGTIAVALDRRTLVVADDGIGIAAKDVPHIFERFYQADGSRGGKGFGLGLSFVKRIVDVHGWSVSVDSEPEKGTSFTVRFGKDDRNS